MNRFLLAAVLLPAVILLSCNEVPAQKKLLILGSSTSQCSFGISVPDSCYVFRVKKYYADRGAPINIDNRARAGDNVYLGMPANFVPPPGRDLPDPSLNITEGLKGNPDVVLINYPSNKYDVFTVGEVMFCLRTLKATANAAGKPCYITTTQPRQDPEFSTSIVRRRMADIKDSVLAEFGQFAINFWDGLVNPVDSTVLPQYYNTTDGHMNDAGQAIFAQRVLAKNIFNLILPVKLVSFTSQPVSNATKIEWTVSAEKDIRSYSLEKSGNGHDFSKIYEVPAINAEKLHGYEFVDARGFGQSAYYRLGTIGVDNFITYSSVLMVEGNRNILEKLYQPDANKMIAVVNAQKEQSMSLRVFNASGQLLQQQKALLRAGSNTITIGIEKLQKGLYFIKFDGETFEIPSRSFSKR